MIGDDDDDGDDDDANVCFIGKIKKKAWKEHLKILLLLNCRGLSTNYL